MSMSIRPRTPAAPPVRALPLPPARTADPQAQAHVREHILLSAAQHGDRLALAALVERHQAFVFSYLRARLLEPSDAEDLTQELFLRTYVGRGPADRSVPVRAWLVGIARNLLREHVRRVRRRKEVAWTEFCLQIEELVDPVGGQFDDVLAQLPDCLASLGPSARQALELHYQGRLRLADIAQRLRRSEGAVKLLMYRARQALKHCLDTRLPDRSHAE